MSNYNAVMIAEGVEEASPMEQLQAWAQLIRTGLCWQLQGCFGRMAKSLIDGGLITPEGELTDEALAQVGE